ncbi:MAG: hypothetical protein M3M95_08230 [Pseudomonadota bacterium]|nr:hypothetical protein [Pseudomonadota bacterium]
MSTAATLACIAAVLGLLLWGQDATRRWWEDIDFLLPLASLAAVWCLNVWEERDGLKHPAYLLLTAWLAAFAPGLALAMQDWLAGEPTVGRFFLALFSAMGRTFSFLGQVGWLFLPALYAGVALCRLKHRIRPRTDIGFWALITALLAPAWPQFVWRLEPTTEQLLVAAGVSALCGALLGWLFSRSGYPPAR